MRIRRQRIGSLVWVVLFVAAHAGFSPASDKAPLRPMRSFNYPYDVVYLSATHAPLGYDNSSPNRELPELVRRWNEESRRPCRITTLLLQGCPGKQPGP